MSCVSVASSTFSGGRGVETALMRLPCLVQEDTSGRTYAWGPSLGWLSECTFDNVSEFSVGLMFLGLRVTGSLELEAEQLVTRE